MSRSPLVKYLANLGYGSRRDVTELLRQRRITDAGGSPLRDSDPVVHADVRVDGEPLDPPPLSLIALHKPVGYVCSTTDPSNPVVYDLLPPRFRHRSPMVAPIGRLDADTSGLLLLSDDGALNHRLTSPRSHVPKVYVATLAAPLRGDEAERFASGTLQLEGDATPLQPAGFDPIGADDATPNRPRARITIAEGRYHQIRRMCAAIGHHVLALHRESVGDLSLAAPPLNALGAGAWCVIPDDVRARVLPDAGHASRNAAAIATTPSPPAP